MSDQIEALKLMRKPFAEHQISKMCKSTKKDNPPGRCRDCGGFHKLPSVQLSYVGHAALTDRLLDADPTWTWEPLALAADGSPLLDANGGLWIKLTVAGVTRLGYGDAQGKTGGDAMKERIGDALRNAGMRFGAALDLWHKGDLHPEIEESATFQKQADGQFVKNETTPPIPPKSTENGQNAPAQVPAAAPAQVKAAEPAPKTRKKKESVPDAGKPWGGEFEPKPAVTVADPPPNANIHGLVIADDEVPFPGDDKPEPKPNPEPARLPTDAERKDFMDRLIVLKNKGFSGIREFLLKETQETITNNIPFLKISALVARLEAEEKAGTLKALLEAK